MIRVKLYSIFDVRSPVSDLIQIGQAVTDFSIKRPISRSWIEFIRTLGANGKF